MKRSCGLLLTAIALLSGFGCNRDDPPAEASQASAPDAAKQETASASESKEYWYAALIDGAPVGYIASSIQPVKLGTADGLRFNTSVLLRVRRGADVTTQRMSLQGDEIVGGGLARFRSQIEAGQTQATTVGTWRDGQLDLQVNAGGTPRNATLAWPPPAGGLFAVEASLHAEPLRPQEVRSITSLMPGMNVPSVSELKAIDLEEVLLLDGPRRLLRVERSDRVGDGPAAVRMRSTLWCNEQGIVEKVVEQDGFRMEQFLTDKQTAIAMVDKGGLDLNELLAVEVAALPEPATLTLVRYRAVVRGGRAADFFPNSGSQTVTAQADGSALIEVRAGLPATATDSPPEPVYLQSNHWIQTADPNVGQLANRVAGGPVVDWRLACELEALVHRRINKKNYTQAFATAAEVAKKLEGDCTEHAVLLAALCRVKRLPSRVAIGLIYIPTPNRPNRGQFAYHMWNEVWLNGRWVGLDATGGKQGIGPTHIKVSDSSLDGVGALGFTLPVVQIVRRLKLEVLDSQGPQG